MSETETHGAGTVTSWKLTGDRAAVARAQAGDWHKRQVGDVSRAPFLPGRRRAVRRLVPAGRAALVASQRMLKFALGTCARRTSERAVPRRGPVRRHPDDDGGLITAGMFLALSRALRELSAVKPMTIFTACFFPVIASSRHLFSLWYTLEVAKAYAGVGRVGAAPYVPSTRSTRMWAEEASRSGLTARSSRR